MFDTTKDLLFLVLAFSAAIFTFFICWALYYVVMMLKRAHEAIKQITDLVAAIKEKVDRLEQLFHNMEKKLNRTASYLPLVLKGVTELIEYFKEKKEKKTARKRSQSS